jgi:hypothetical protein
MFKKNQIARIVVGILLAGMAITLVCGCDGSLGKFKQQTTWEFDGLQFGTKDLNLQTAKGNVVGLNNSQGKESAKRASSLNKRASKLFK